jgi:HlyD family secretion protein
MKKLVHSRSFYTLIALAVITVIVLMMFGIGQEEHTTEITTTAEIGPVRELVSVSGIAESEQTAQLTFPINGIVKKVNVKKGDKVKAGDILLELERDALLADRTEALSRITQAVANRDELLSGPTDSTKNVTSQTLEQAKESLITISKNEQGKIDNAYRALLSGGLTTYSDDPSEPATPPVVSGSYTCDTEGTYRLQVFSSNAQSGYSYYLTGIEAGTYSVSTQQAIALGDCGLRIQFDPNSNYSRTIWNIDIPNQKSTLYVSNRNTYALTVTQAESAIANAEQVVKLAEANATNNNAAPRNEAVTRANASISQAQAQLARIDATIQERILRASFDGTITDIDVLAGEAVSTLPVLTLLADSDFEITAKIPEIDIGKLRIGQKVELVFDTKSTETIYGEITYISLRATEIEGVAYFESSITLDEVPTWLRSGLNADINIIISEEADYVRIPKRFLIKSDSDTFSVLTKHDGKNSTTTVEVVLEGNDGYVSITGLAEGEVIIAP